MKISPREMILAWMTGVVALGGLTYLLVEPQTKDWQILNDKRTEANRQVENQKRLISQAGKWNARLAELKKRLPTHPPGKDVTTDLQILIERLAKANTLTLINREAEKETLRGNMYEVAVDCKWEGKLESLTRFLFDLQKEDVILDIRFTVYCSYSRATPPGSEPKNETKGKQNDVLSP